MFDRVYKIITFITVKKLFSQLINSLDYLSFKLPNYAR